MAYRLREAVTPSGVRFVVRNLVGQDQDTLSQAKNGETESSFNKMLASALMELGDIKDVTPDHVKSLLSTDRKFILVTMRQHTLNFMPEFKFNFEWPLRVGYKDKELIEYTVNFSSKNFPVKPPIWMSNAIKVRQEEAKVKNEEFPEIDGYNNFFPQLYSSYKEMLVENSYYNGTFSDGRKYKWRLLTGETEAKWTDAIRNNMRINLMLDMRAPVYEFTPGQYAMFETQKEDIMLLEQLRREIKDVEGDVDTFLAIIHPTDPSRQQRVDLLQLPAFFFPSEAL